MLDRSVVLSPPLSPFYFVFETSKLLMYKKKYKEEARSPYSGNHFSSLFTIIIGIEAMETISSNVYYTIEIYVFGTRQ